MQAPNYTLTNDSLTIIWNGKPVTVQKGAPNFIPLKTAIINEEWNLIEKNLTIPSSLETWAKGKFTVVNDNLHYDGKPIPSELNRRALAMATENKDPTAILNFWERLQKNPSWRSVQQLWKFLDHAGIPLTPDGCFLAYKGVRDNYLDSHSGKFDNSPGNVHEMPRNQISDDPKEACHEGFHVGALNYARGFASRVVVCKVDPADVVCVPYDSSFEKMRVCRYEVVGNHGAQLPSTVYEEALPAGSSSPIVEVRPTQQHIDFVDSAGSQESEDDEGDESGEEGDYDDDAYQADDGYNDGDDEASEEASEDVDEDGEEEPSARPNQGISNTKVKRVANKKLDALDMAGLMELSIQELRHYATHNMMIVGASKIPGGKTALVLQILKTRGE